nr:MAG TPA: hypothetical protein [Crassvirales sp.]
MNYISKITELSKQCLKESDVNRVKYWLDSRNLISIKEIVTSEFIKFKSKKPVSLEDKPLYDEMFAIFADLESTIVEYLRLNDYEEDELNIPYDEEY